MNLLSAATVSMFVHLLVFGIVLVVTSHPVVSRMEVIDLPVLRATLIPSPVEGKAKSDGLPPVQKKAADLVKRGEAATAAVKPDKKPAERESNPVEQQALPHPVEVSLPADDARGFNNRQISLSGGRTAGPKEPMAGKSTTKKMEGNHSGPANEGDKSTPPPVIIAPRIRLIR